LDRLGAAGISFRHRRPPDHYRPDPGRTTDAVLSDHGHAMINLTLEMIIPAEGKFLRLGFEKRKYWQL
jgi:hypothetical protein